MRGYFGIGVEGISKEGNVGALLRTAHAFGASFAFAIAPVADVHGFREADTSAAVQGMPFYTYARPQEIVLPQGCRMVGIELLDGSIDLPSFRHPHRAVYVLGPERGGLSDAVLARCDFTVKIPTRFSLNLALCGGLVLYDRMISLGRHAPRPVRAGGPTEPAPAHVQGEPRFLRHRRTAGDG